MYEAFFNLSGLPFGRNISVDNLWMNTHRQELHSRLLHVVENKMFGVFTGDAGTGKSTSIRRFSSLLDKNLYHILYITDSQLTPRNFYVEALHKLNYAPRFYRGDARRQLCGALHSMSSVEEKTPVVIIDEAHLLSHEMLEEVRFLLNEEMDSVSNLALILAGQSELKDKLKFHINHAIQQRIDMRYHLPPLTSEETNAYINAHMAAVQANRAVFTASAVGLIHNYSGGIPRRINKVAIACLMSAASRKVALIDDAIVSSVIEYEFEV